MNNLMRLGIVFLAAFTASTIVFAEHTCNDCHNSNTPSSSDLKKPLSSLCADCHQARIAAGEHQVDIPATFTSSSTLPLQNGKMTCITCHDPHKSSLALRMADPEHCTQCHFR